LKIDPPQAEWMSLRSVVFKIGRSVLSFDPEALERFFQQQLIPALRISELIFEKRYKFKLKQ